MLLKCKLCNFTVNYSECFVTHLKEPCKDVKLEDRDVVVTGEVDSGFERHGLQT